MKSKKLISLILSVTMIVPLLPVWAEGDLQEQPEGAIANVDDDYIPIDEQTTEILKEMLQVQANGGTESLKPEAVASQTAETTATIGATDAKETVAASDGEGTLVGANGYWHESMEQYQQYDYSDPNYITDEEFFGVWNGSSWTSEPYIDYSYGGALVNAEDAVKAGDYDSAKEYVLEYYRDKFNHQPRTITGSSDRRVNLTAEIAFDNLFFNQPTGFQPLDKFYVPSGYSEVSANVVEEVQSAAAATSKKKCFVMVALKKDGYQVDFNSADADSHQPYIVANVNGTNRTFYPTQDAMISAGDNASKNYKHQTTISVQESNIRTNPEVVPSSANASKTNKENTPTDSDTKRIYMNFDFTGLSASDEITEARLYLYGSSTNPDGKDVVIFSNTNAEWSEETVTWNNLEHLIYSYDGESGPRWVQPGDAGYRFHEEMNRMSTSAYRQTYIYTGDEVYAYHLLRIWLDFYKKRGSDPGYYNNLDLGCRAQALIPTVAYLINSEFMTKEVFTPLLKFAWSMADALVDRWNNKSLTSNWGGYETAGLSYIAINFNEFYDATKPLASGATYENGGRGGWNEVAGYRYLALCGTILNSDGSCTECSVEYSAEAITQAMQQASIAEDAGVSDYEIAESLQPLLVDLAKYLVNATGPGGVDFQQGNAASYTTSHYGTVKRVLKYIDDPLLKWAVNRDEGEKPDYTSILYPVGVKAYLRNGWEDNDIYLQTNADGGVVSHGHADDMGLNMFAYGQYLLVDPKYMNYNDNNPYRAWLNSSRAHNTVEINDTSTKSNLFGLSTTVTGPSGETVRLPSGGTAGSIKDSELNDAYDYITLNTPNYLNVSVGGQTVNVDYDRSILFLHSGYVIVTDYLKPQNNSVNKYSQGWHFLPDANPTIDEETGAVRTNFADSANIQVIPVQQNDTMEKNLLDGWYSYSTGNVQSAKYATYVKNQSGITTFNTVLLPMYHGQELNGTTENITLDVAESVANAFRLTIEEEARNLTTEGTFYTLLDTTQQAQREFGTYSTDGTLAYVEQENGIYNQVILRNGTNVVNNEDGVQLLRSKSTIGDLEVSYNSSTIELDTSEEINLLGVQLYSGGKTIKTVKLNGESINFKQDGETGDVYFATAKPVFDGNNSDNVNSGTSTSTPKPPTGGTVHGGGGGGGGSVSVSTPTPTATPTPEETPTTDSTPTPNVTPTTRPSEQYQQELSGHWAETEISEMLDEGIIEGTGTGSLELGSQTTRAEFVTMLVRALGMELQDYDGEYADVSAEDWYADYIATATKEGILQGDGTNANPNALITREEMAKILVETYERENGEIEVQADTVEQFQDLAVSSGWAEGYVRKAIAAGLMNGISNELFAPLDNALREQAIVVVYRIMKKEE